MPAAAAPDAAPVLADGGVDHDRRVVRWRTLAALGLVLVTYHTSLWTLLRGITVDTPLAYLGLVPAVAAALGYALARPAAGEPDIHDRLVDRIVGVPLVVAALVGLVLLPARMSVVYWLWRIDLLTMPLFVAGVVALLFGTRMLWRTKAAVLFLFLAWPVPARWLVSTFLDPLADITARIVGIVVGIVPIADKVPGDVTAFQIPYGAEGFRVQVASACSGANGLVGFLLVAGAIALALDGRRRRKFLWLVSGALLVLALNVVRILLIITVGRFAGQTASVDVLHPIVGLLTFNVGVLVMVLQAHRFGLYLRMSSGPSRTRAVLAGVPRARRALVMLVPLALLGGFFDHRLTDYDPIASSVGTPRLAGFARSATRPPGFEAQVVSTFDNGRRFFGQDSVWLRYAFRGTGTPDLASDVAPLADVITTSNLQAFSDFGLEACYQFHGYDMDGVRQVDLGNGVIGTVLRWSDPNNGLRWTTLYWIWAVRQGGQIRYERVVLLLNEVDGARVVAPELTEDVAGEFALRADELVRGRSGGALTERQLQLRSFLITFGRRLVESATERSARLPIPREPGQ